MNDCIFCKIIAREIPNFTVYEDDDIMSFLDIQPRAKGHTVLIPKEHVKTIFELNDDKALKIVSAIKKTMEKIKAVLNPDGFSVGWNHGAAGGQVVPHLHVHIFPRWNEDGGGNQHTIINNPGDESVSDLAVKFKRS